MSTDFAAIVPIVTVTLAACAAMVAEAFKRPGERMPIGGLGIIGLIGAAAASIFLWNRDASGFGVIRADNFSLFFNLVLVAIGILTIMLSGQSVDRERCGTRASHEECARAHGERDCYLVHCVLQTRGFEASAAFLASG